MRLDLRSQALLISQGNSRADSWETALFAGLGGKAGEYEKVYPSFLLSFPLTSLETLLMLMLVGNDSIRRSGDDHPRPQEFKTLHIEGRE